jgi:hypothetical protein
VSAGQLGQERGEDIAGRRDIRARDDGVEGQFVTEYPGRLVGETDAADVLQERGEVGGANLVIGEITKRRS